MSMKEEIFSETPWGFLATPTSLGTYDPGGVQIGGDHYRKCKIQPFDYIRENNIPHAEGEVICKVTRWRDKNGIQDLEKCIHTLQLIIDRERTKINQARA